MAVGALALDQILEGLTEDGARDRATAQTLGAPTEAEAAVLGQTREDLTQAALMEAGTMALAPVPDQSPAIPTAAGAMVPDRTLAAQARAR
jgi:hypothetical protein